MILLPELDILAHSREVTPLQRYIAEEIATDHVTACCPDVRRCGAGATRVGTAADH